VVGDGLLPSDLPVTGPTLLRGAWRLRRVGLVAGRARGLGVVRHGIDLGKPCRPGGIVSVADGAKGPVPVDDGFDLHGVGHVGGGRSVADFAGNPLVVGGGPDRFHVSVAKSAFLTPRVCLLESLDGVHRSGPVVTQLAKGVGDEEISRDEEGGAHNGEGDEKTRDLLWHAVHPFRWGNRIVLDEGEPRPNPSDPGPGKCKNGARGNS